MYVCFLDATKAFDRVDYTVLFQKLSSRNVPGYIVKFLWNWYSKHCGQAFNRIALTFAMVYVRQGGMLSPFLFALYIDQLSIHLQAVNVGCRLGNLIVNHFLFADDIDIFAPSAKRLQELLDVCSNFADTHRVVFNVSKSQCLIVHSKGDTFTQPVFRLCSFALPYTDNYEYLGHFINSRLTDDADIMRQTRSLYATANGVVRKFSSSSLCTKLLLFKAFCTPIYGCSLWCSMFQYSLNKLRVAYNDAFRFLLNEPRWCSASRLFVLHNIPSFSAVIRKSIYSLRIVIMFLCRLFYCPIYACYSHF